MSDLHCPATFVVVGPGRPVPEDDPAVPIAAVHVAADRGIDTAAGAAAGAAHDRGPDGALPLDDGPLWEVLHDLADLYRGCRVVVLPARVEAPLTAADDLVVVRIDADGASVNRP